MPYREDGSWDPNPLFQDEKDGKWYFYDCTWTDAYGPYETKEEAEKNLEEYCKEL